MTTLEEKLLVLMERSVKLERMMVHFAHEQERYLEPARQHMMLDRKHAIFHSQPSLSAVSFDLKEANVHKDSDDSGDEGS